MQTIMATARERALTPEELEILNQANRGFDATLGLRYTHISNGEVRGELEVGPGHHQPWGIANGGVYASIAESLGSIAGIVAAGGAVMGVNNNTNFIKPVRSGTIKGVARPTQVGRRTQLWVVDMFQEETLVATSVLRTIVAAPES